MELVSTSGAQWLFHLWFLMNILIYSFIFSIVVIMARSLWGERIYEKPLFYAPILASALVCLIGVVAMGAAKVVGATLILSSGLIFYGIPFVCGIVFSYMDPNLARLGASSFSKLVVLSVLVVLPFLVSDGEGALRVAYLFAVSLSGVAMGALLISIGTKLRSQPSRTVDWLVKASLPIYIIHHPVAMACGFIAQKHFVDVGVQGFVIVLLLTAVVSLVCARAVMANGVLRFLFVGGTRRPQGSVVATVKDRP